MIGDELAHTIRHLVAQAMVDQRPFVYGHISSYDATRHRVRCIIPSMQDEQGLPLLSPWMPMGSPTAGAGYGMQVFYQGGATVDKPTAGEQVIINLFDRGHGVSAAPAMHYHDNALPPTTALPPSAAPPAAGDILISNPSGTLLRIHANGDFEIMGKGKFIVTADGDASVSTNGTATVHSDGDATVTSGGTITITAESEIKIICKAAATIVAPAIRLTSALGNTLLGLCTSAFRDWAATHTHPSTGTPTSPPPGNSVTTIVSGE